MTPPTTTPHDGMNEKHVEILCGILEARNQTTIRSQVLVQVLAFSKEEVLTAMSALDTPRQSEIEEAKFYRKQAELNMNITKAQVLELESEMEKLRRENEEKISQIERLNKTIDELQAECDTYKLSSNLLREECIATEKKWQQMQDYTMHYDNCMAILAGTECTCGLDELLHPLTT